MAGRDATYIRETARKILLRKNGWNVDVPLSFPSKYRKRKKQEEKDRWKHLSYNGTVLYE